MTLRKYLETHGLLERVLPVAQGVEDVLDSYRVAINYRATSRFGCVKHNKKTVELTHGFFEGQTLVREDEHTQTLLHETAHVLVRAMYPFRKVQAHGREWKSIMRQLGAPANRSSGHEGILPERNTDYKHSYVCADCAYEYKSKRALKNIGNRYHSGCKRKPNGGALIHTQLR